MRCLIVLVALCAAGTMAEDKKAESLKAVTDSTGHFSVKFFQEVAKEKKNQNLITSALSADMVLTMAAYGAAGNTGKQMREALHLPADDAVSRQGYESLIDNLNNVKNVTLELANKIYLANDLKIKSSFKELTTSTFRSESAELDMNKPKESADIVNAWVDEKTHHKINGIVKADDLTPNTRMILLNAVYFKGNWGSKFNKDATKKRDFYLADKSKKEVDTMFKVGRFFYGELSELNAQFIELPYANKDLKMIIIVPKEVDGLNDLVDKLHLINSSYLAKNGYEREVQLYLPKFKIESEIPLESTLKKMGMTDMFEDSANFSGISNEPLKVAKVLQKAFIEVNEEGSEAAAVTAIQAVATSALISPPQPTIFRADRPFFFEIRDYNNNLSLFNGNVVHP